MDSSQRESLEQQCKDACIVLKNWEADIIKKGLNPKSHEVQKSHGYKIPYKKYEALKNQLNQLTGKSAPKQAKPVLQNPEKPAKASHATTPPTTPRRHNLRYDAPEESPTAQFSTYTYELGPTPQKDGIVLGLFDTSPDQHSSPSRRTVLGDVNPNLLQTPLRKRKADHEDVTDDDDDDTSVPGRKMPRTPMSATTRWSLNQLATPQKCPREHDDGSPSSAFFRKSSIVETHRREWAKEEEERRQAELQAKVEAEAADVDPDEDEEEALRELEATAAGDAPVPRSTASMPPPTVPAAGPVGDSASDMKLGADGENPSDSEPAVDAPRRVWKKKGAKRQTRRVTMRPVHAKPQSSQHVDLDSDGDSDATVVPVGSDDDDDDYESDNSPQQRKKQQSKAPAAKQQKESDVPKKRTRKISAQSHANFCRLKIKKKGNGKKHGRGGRR